VRVIEVVSLYNSASNMTNNRARSRAMGIKARELKEGRGSRGGGGE